MPSTSGTCGTIGPKLMPFGCAFSFVQRDAVGVLAVAVAERPGAQGEVEDALGPTVGRSARGSSRRRGPA